MSKSLRPTIPAEGRGSEGGSAIGFERFHPTLLSHARRACSLELAGKGAGREGPILSLRVLSPIQMGLVRAALDMEPYAELTHSDISCFKCMDPAMREARMRSRINSIWDSGDWIAMVVSGAAPIKHRIRLIEGELAQAKTALGALYDSGFIDRPSDGEKWDCLSDPSVLPPSLRFYLEGSSPGELKTRFLGARTSRRHLMYREWMVCLTSFSTLLEKVRFRPEEPLAPDEANVLGYLVSAFERLSGSNLKSSMARKDSLLSFHRAIVADGLDVRFLGRKTDKGALVNEVLSLFPSKGDPLLTEARATADMRLLLDFLGVHHLGGSARTEPGMCLGRKASYHEESDDSMTSIVSSPQADRKRFTIDAVFDGVGGEEGGHIASRIARETLEIAILNGWISSPEDVRANILLSDIQILGQKVRTQRSAMLRSGGMGTTAVVVMKRGDHIFGIHSGDSPYKLVHEGKVLTATLHGLGNMILTSLGSGAEFVSVNNHGRRLDRPGGLPSLSVHRFEPIEARKGDIIIVCSDGISDVVQDTEIALIVEESLGIAPQDAPARGGNTPRARHIAKRLMDLSAQRRDSLATYPSIIGDGELDGKDDDRSLIVREIV